MSLGDRLRSRKQPTEVVRLPLDPAEHARLERDLQAATWAWEESRSRGSVDLDGLRDRVTAAQAALDACECEQITLRALPPAEWEALIDSHPPSEEQRAGGAQWNTTTFRPALLAASVVPAAGDEPLSEADWEQLAKDGSLAAGELNALFNLAVNLNLRSPSSAVGKD